ncbi:MAG: amidohydrolase [Chitinophagaceae bacterium]
MISNTYPFPKTLLAGLLIMSLIQVQAQKSTPDLIMINGTIITVDKKDRIAEAIAIKENKIMAIGTTKEINALAGKATKIINLNKRTVTPGLLDAHIHFSSSPWSVPNMIDISYPNAKSIVEIKKIIAQKVKEIKPGEWIQGVGWDEGKLTEKRLVSANDLDEVAPDNPVWLTHTTGHYGVANSIALQLANIEINTPNPPEGVIERDENNNATGVLKESAMRLVGSLLPSSTIANIEAGILTMTQALNAEGMTGIKDPGLSDARWTAYQNVLHADKLNLRVFGLWPGGKSTGSISNIIQKQSTLPTAFRIGNDHLISGGIKLFADGSGGARTAWLYDEWNKDISDIDSGNRGFLNIEADTLRVMILLGHEAGIHVSTHAIGDRTIDLVLDSYTEALQIKPAKGLRHGIIHANIPTQRALDQMLKLQQLYDAAYPEPSATFTWWIGDTYAGNFGERAKRLNPFATFKRMGIRWANGSDYSVTPFPARYGLWASIARKPALQIYGGDPFGREESVDVKTALKSATIWAAHQMFLEHKIGSIEIGKYADLAVWDRNLYNITTDEIKDMKCMLTIFNGKIVYRSDEFK